MGLPQQHRIRGHRAFAKLHRQGQRRQGQWMVLRLLPADPTLLPALLRRQPSSPWRCAVVVSGKVHKRAVRRNRLRRLLQEELRRQPLQPRRPLWLLISLRPGSAEVEESRLLGECRQLLQLAGLRHG